MKQAVALFALSSVAVCVAPAGELTEVASGLESGLAEQVQLLARVTDAATAADAVEPLAANLRQLAALNGRVPTTDLWNHIETTPELKKKLMSSIHQISISFCRILEADYYGCAALRQLLHPLLTPASDAPGETEPRQ